MKRLFYTLRARSDCRRAIRELRRLEYRLPSQEARFAVPFVFRGAGLFKSIRARQTPREIEGLYRVVCGFSPRTLLEIGTAKGGTLYLWTQAAREDAILISLDLPAVNGGYDQAREPLYEAFPKPHQELRLLRADSHSPAALAEVRSILAGRALDFLFIDADHTFSGCRTDLLLYGPLVRPGGSIGFHDIRPRPDRPDIQVDRLWSQLKARYPVTEFVTPNKDGQEVGLGLLEVPAGGLDWERLPG